MQKVWTAIILSPLAMMLAGLGYVLFHAGQNALVYAMM